MEVKTIRAITSAPGLVDNLPQTVEPTTGLEPVNLFLTKEVLYLLSYVGLYLLIIPETPQTCQGRLTIFGGEGRIRTSEGVAGRFTVCSLWPLGNLTTFFAIYIPTVPAAIKPLELLEGAHRLSLLSPLAPVAYFGIWSWRWDLNPQPADYKSAALPIELRQPRVRNIPHSLLISKPKFTLVFKTTDVLELVKYDTQAQLPQYQKRWSFLKAPLPCASVISALILIVLDGHNAEPGKFSWSYKDGILCKAPIRKRKRAK